MYEINLPELELILNILDIHQKKWKLKYLVKWDIDVNMDDVDQTNNFHLNCLIISEQISKKRIHH
ncbi:MAG: hypothetical protein K0Q85_1216 [Caproiciproducens sp.]|jgi:hypothetical protein|nr:hypothetical protein [Caproiciproducens sp.]